MSTKEDTAPKPDVYQRVTDAIVSAIESGVGEFRMPWTTRGDKDFRPISVGSAKAYRGINTLVLWAQSQSKGLCSRIYGWNGLGERCELGPLRPPKHE